MALKRRKFFSSHKDDTFKQTTLDCFFKKNAKTVFLQDKKITSPKRKRTRKRSNFAPNEASIAATAAECENSRVEIVVERRRLPYSIGSPDSENDAPFKLCFNKDGDAFVETIEIGDDENNKTMFINKPKHQKWNYRKNRPRILENIVLNMPENTPINTTTYLSVKSFQSVSGICETTANESTNNNNEIINISDDSDEEKQVGHKRVSSVNITNGEPASKKSYIETDVNVNFTSKDLGMSLSLKRRYSEDTVILDDNFGEESNVTTEHEISEVNQVILNTSRDKNDKLYASTSKNNSFQKTTDNNEASDITFEAVSSVSSAYENEDKYRNIKYFREILDCLRIEKLITLLPCNEIKTLEYFFQMEEKYQLFCYKLYTRKRNWQNIFDFCKHIKLDMSEEAISKMYKFLCSTNLVKTDYLSEDLSKLLHLLRLPDIKDICETFRMKVAKNDKETMINKLLNNCNKQCTLSDMNTENVLRHCIGKKLGSCVKISHELVNAFHHTYILYSFTNTELVDVAAINFFMYKLENTQIVLPNYKKRPITIFKNTEEFLSFSRAYECKNELLKAIDSKNTSVILDLCQLAYDEFHSILNSNVIVAKPKFLLRFTPGAKYASILSIGSKQLSKQEPENVCKWLKLLISQNIYCQHKRGFWYDQLIMVQIYHLKKHNDAKDTLLEALKDTTLSEIAKHELSIRGTNMKNNMKRFKLEKSDRDTINFLLKPRIEKVPEVEIDAKAKRSSVSGKKRMYEVYDANGDRRFISVENIAIEYYRTLGYEGMHCENTFLINLFFILFWDIIYEFEVEGAFISNIQYYPLDLFSEDFYINRRKVINERLSEISSTWNEDTLKKQIKKVIDKHLHEKSLLVESLIDSPEQLCCFITCIGRKSLSKMLERLVKNFPLYHSGMPDLFLWNIHEKKCKFVEVKGENDKLSINQKLWLKYLNDIGIEAEVCYVHSKGSKRRSIKKNND